MTQNNPQKQQNNPQKQPNQKQPNQPGQQGQQGGQKDKDGKDGRMAPGQHDTDRNEGQRSKDATKTDTQNPGQRLGDNSKK